MTNKTFIDFCRNPMKESRNGNNEYGEFVKPWKGKDGYTYYTLYDKFGNPHNERDDKLVASSFVPNPDPVNFTEIRHKDGNKNNNDADNLEWCAPND